MPEDFRRINQNVEYGKAALAAQRLKDAGFYEEPDGYALAGYYSKPGVEKRLIIGRDTPINKGVYVGASEREAVVVDDQKDEPLHTAYGDLLIALGKLRDQYRTATETILQEVYQLVLKKIPYNAEMADRIMQAAGSNDGRVALGSYITSHGGVCRHEALLAGYLIERLIGDGKIGNETLGEFGRVSVDRNAIHGKGGHAWVRYEDDKNQVWVIDAAQQYCGRLDDVPEEAWFYERLPQTVEAEKNNSQQPPVADPKRGMLDALRKLIGRL